MRLPSPPLSFPVWVVDGSNETGEHEGLSNTNSSGRTPIVVCTNSLSSPLLPLFYLILSSWTGRPQHHSHTCEICQRPCNNLHRTRRFNWRNDHPTQRTARYLLQLLLDRTATYTIHPLDEWPMPNIALPKQTPTEKTTNTHAKSSHTIRLCLQTLPRAGEACHPFPY